MKMSKCNRKRCECLEFLGLFTYASIVCRSLQTDCESLTHIHKYTHSTESIASMWNQTNLTFLIIKFIILLCEWVGKIPEPSNRTLLPQSHCSICVRRSLRRQFRVWMLLCVRFVCVEYIVFEIERKY